MKTRLFWVKLKILFIFIIAKYLNISAKDCCDCCKDCFKSKEIIKTTNENGEQYDDLSEQCYDLNKINTLEEIDLNQDLEKIFIQLLSEKLYNVFDVYSLDKKFNPEAWKKKDKNSKEAVSSYEENAQEQLKNFFNEKYIITRNKFKNISNDFIKILATFFLKEDDYNEYLKECVNKGEKENIQNDNNKKDISILLNTDQSLRDALNTYINNNSDFLIELGEDNKQKLKLLSEKLQLCSPYKGTTYRGTKIYNKEQEALGLEENNKEENYKIIETFLNKIRSTTWYDKPSDKWLISFSSDTLVAGYFALKHPNLNHFPVPPLFRMVIRNNINKTGVYLYENWDPKNKKITDGIPKEREVLYPQGSKFKILGVRLEILKTYPPSGIPDLYETIYKDSNGKWVKSLEEEEEETETKDILIDENKRTAQNFECPFIVLDVVEE